MTRTVHEPTPMKSTPKRIVPRPKIVPIWHFYGIKGHIKLHYHKLRNQLRNQRKKKY